MVEKLNFSYCQNYLQAGIDNLENYLLSDNLYGNLGVSSYLGQSYPSLTLGSLLLHQKYAGCLAETESQRLSYQEIETQFNVLRTRWRVAWERKAAWEFESRLEQWGHMLNEIRDEPHENNPYYQYEVRNRVMLSLLGSEISKIDPAYLEQFESQDLLLRMMLEPGDFIWDIDLVPAFPQTGYWYLWGLPKER